MNNGENVTQAIDNRPLPAMRLINFSKPLTFFEMWGIIITVIFAPVGTTALGRPRNVGATFPTTFPTMKNIFVFDYNREDLFA